MMTTSVWVVVVVLCCCAQELAGAVPEKNDRSSSSSSSSSISSKVAAELEVDRQFEAFLHRFSRPYASNSTEGAFRRSVFAVSCCCRRFCLFTFVGHEPLCLPGSLELLVFFCLKSFACICTERCLQTTPQNACVVHHTPVSSLFGFASAAQPDCVPEPNGNRGNANTGPHSCVCARSVCRLDCGRVSLHPWRLTAVCRAALHLAVLLRQHPCHM